MEKRAQKRSLAKVWSSRDSVTLQLEEAGLVLEGGVHQMSPSEVCSSQNIRTTGVRWVDNVSHSQMPQKLGIHLHTSHSPSLFWVIAELVDSTELTIFGVWDSKLCLIFMAWETVPGTPRPPPFATENLPSFRENIKG